MKIIFEYKEIEGLGLVESFEIKMTENEKVDQLEEYEQYLLTSTVQDFHYIAIFDEYYNKLKAMRNKEIEDVSFEGNNFKYYATLEKVIITKKSSQESWECTFEEYRKVIKAWKEFIGLNRKPQTKVEVKI